MLAELVPIKGVASTTQRGNFIGSQRQTIKQRGNMCRLQEQTEIYKDTNKQRYKPKQETRAGAEYANFKTSV